MLKIYKKKLKDFNMLEKEKFMNEALREAKKAYEKAEIPVGAIIVKNRKNNSKSSQFKRN